MTSLGSISAGYAYRVLFYLIVGSWIDVLLLLAGARANVYLCVAPVFAAAVVTTAGELLLVLFGLRRLTAWLLTAFVAGVTITSVFMMIPTMMLHWSAQSAFIGWSCVVFLSALISSRKRSRLPTMSWPDCAIIFLFAAFVGYFCREQVGAVPILMKTNVLPTWVDYFAHGTTIASFGSPLAVHSGNIMLPGSSRVFYHYGPFMLAAALTQVSGLSGLALAVAIVLPLGLLVGLCGLFALAAEIAGAGPALLAIWFVTCLPDASHYLLSNGFFGFLWLAFTTPGAGYAIGGASIAYACALPWFERRQIGSLPLPGLLVLMLILMRANMFILMAPAFAAAIVLTVLQPPWRLRVLAGALITVTFLTWLLVAGFLGTAVMELVQPSAYVDLVFSMGPHSYASFVYGLGQPVGVIVGALLLVPATLGLWTLALPMVVVAESMRQRFRPVDYLPCLLSITYLLLIFWAPMAGNNDITEYKERHFLLLYAIVAVWTTVRLLRLVGATQWLLGWRPSRVVAVVSVGGLLTMFAYRHVDPGHPLTRMTWAQSYYAVHVEPGIPQAAIFLRTHAHSGDIMAIGGHGAIAMLTGPALELVSMTNMPCYVGRIAQDISTRPLAIVALVKRRAAIIAAVDNSADRAAALRLLQAQGIRWYVMVAPDRPAWDTHGSYTAFSAGSVYVYRVDTENKPPVTKF